MKKYITPSVEINETETIEMMALSLQNGNADDSAVLTNEQQDTNLWNEETEE